jgi:DNA-binding MarR family transcriptional regulator
VTHPIARIDDVVHQRVRLGILTLLTEVAEADFNYLRDHLDLTAGNLSRHLTVLEEAGYVDIEKTVEASRPRTWIHITQEGTAALQEEIAALRQLLAELT